MAESISEHRIRAILVLLATAMTIAFNVLASTGYINGVTPAEISAKYPTILTPADYAFSIWSLVYVGLIAFSIYQLLPENLERFGGIRTLYIASCVLNCGWLYFWHNEWIGVCLVLSSALTASLIVMAATFRTTVTTLETFAVKGTLGLYAGWVTIATLVNLFVYLRSIGSDAGVSTTVGVVAILAAMVAAIVMTWRFRNHFYPFAVAWGLTAIAVKQSGNTAIVVACALGVIVSLLMSISFVLSLPSSTTRLRENE